MRIGTNTAIFDGYSLDETFSAIKSAGINVIELAYNEGYVGNLTPDLFSEKNARHVIELLGKHALETHAFGCTMNLAKENAVAEFTMRIQFAHAIGAKYLNACVGNKENRERILKNLHTLAPIAEDNGCIICIENGGDKNFDLVATAEDAMDILESAHSKAVAINLDPGNIVSMRPGVQYMDEAKRFFPFALHCHIKDVILAKDNYFFKEIGSGILDYSHLINHAIKNDIPCNFEIPLRMHRLHDATPVRSETPASLASGIETLKLSKKFITEKFGNTLF
ncbi:sugar phosphate isomerase/epimerase family protein [Martelella alba]|uniref:Sugar phosphate isomerase/epimerase n=1 Tax=Martelella alba TaxID=2590451 RepID=A0ABY2SKC3_9HYPH|nr:sugar phosphate isomerase/epimerase family protein [Martelella alba]TKI05987.1 sugar phosphate isomerase/epimerase [Martelella alba]